MTRCPRRWGGGGVFTKRHGPRSLPILLPISLVAVLAGCSAYFLPGYDAAEPTWLLDSLGEIEDSTPYVGPSGATLVTSEATFSAVLHSVTADGAVAWSYRLPSNYWGVSSSPRLLPDGTILVASGWDLVALDHTGSELWTFDMYHYPHEEGRYSTSPPTTSPLLVGANTIAIGGGGYLFFVGVAGSEIARVDLGSYVQTDPAYLAGVIVVATIDGTVHGLDETGGSVWEIHIDATLKRSVVSLDDDAAVFGTADGRLICVSADGVVLWEHNVETDSLSELVGTPDGLILFAAGDQRLHAISREGTVLWSFFTGDAYPTSPTIGADGTIFFIDRGRLVAFSPDGTEAFRATAGLDRIVTPFVGGIVGISAESLVCYEIDSLREVGIVPTPFYTKIGGSR